MANPIIPLITPMLPESWLAVREIYSQGIATGTATFETELPDWEKWNNSHRKECRLLALEAIAGDRANRFELLPDLRIDLGADKFCVLGWAALSPLSSRAVYSGVAEVSVYVAAGARGSGVGKALLQALTNESELHGIWTLQAGIFPENLASIALHKFCGFREVGVRRRIGKLGTAWKDVLLLERRSSVVGV